MKEARHRLGHPLRRDPVGHVSLTIEHLGSDVGKCPLRGVRAKDDRRSGCSDQEQCGHGHVTLALGLQPSVEDLADTRRRHPEDA